MQTEIRLAAGSPIFDFVTYIGKVEQSFAALLGHCQCGTHCFHLEPLTALHVVSSSQGLFFLSVMKRMYRISESSGKHLI
jgi:hypothetical protein